MSNFKGVFISAEILRDDRLTATDKFLLGYIVNFKSGCFASDKYIAETLGVGAKTVRNSLTKLRSLGLIGSTSINGKRRLGCPGIGTMMSLNKDNDVPKSGQLCPEIGNRQQGNDPCANNNSNKNLKTNSSSNATTTTPDSDLVSESIKAFQKYHGLGTSSGLIDSILNQARDRGWGDGEIVEYISGYFDSIESDSAYARTADSIRMTMRQRDDFLLLEYMEALCVY